VVIDTLSGRVVIPPDESRRDVNQACQRGEQAIDTLFQNWLDKSPVETKSMLDILALSCQDAAPKVADAENTESANNAKADQYLVRKEKVGCGKDDAKTDPKNNSAARVKEIFSRLVSEGMEPNGAAAEAIKQATAEQKNPSVTTKLEEGKLCGTMEKCAVKTDSNVIKSMAEKMRQLHAGDKSKMEIVLSTAKKYVSNVQKDPSNPRFRCFRLSNKVFDRITSTPGSIELLKSIGFAFFPSDVDFVANIPLTVDLVLMGDVFDNLLKTGNNWRCG